MTGHNVLKEVVNLLATIDNPTKEDAQFAWIIAREWDRTVSTTYILKRSQSEE